MENGNDMEFNQPLDDISFDSDYDQQEISVIGVNKFVIFCLLTFGLYQLWWVYKSWKFFKEKDNLDIMPAARAIFAVFFIFYLFEEILNFAKSVGYQKSYSSIGLTIGFIIFNLAARLPDPMWMISLVGFIFFLQPFQAFNYALTNSENYRAVEEGGLNTRQIVMVIIGVLFWALVLLGLFIEVPEGDF